MPDPISEELRRVRQELIKQQGGLDGYFKYVQKLDRARRRSTNEKVRRQKAKAGQKP